MKKASPRADVATPSIAEKLRKGNLLATGCPSRQVLRHLTSRWGVLVLIVLEDGTCRFSELRRAIGGVSERMLAQTLQSLEHDGILKRKAFDVVPPHVEYSLTPLGRQAARKVRVLADWIEARVPQIARTWEERKERDRPARRRSTSADRSA